MVSVLVVLLVLLPAKTTMVAVADVLTIVEVAAVVLILENGSSQWMVVRSAFCSFGIEMKENTMRRNTLFDSTWLESNRIESN